jgi:hypothetical protein
MILTLIPKTAVKAAIKTSQRISPKTKSNTMSINRPKEISRKRYLQYEGKEIQEDVLLEKFKFEWCKEYKIAELKDLKIYYKFEDKKAYFVANGSVTIIIDY